MQKPPIATFSPSRDRSRSLLNSIENVNISKITVGAKKREYAVLYTWHCPDEDLRERRRRTDQRREELLELLYQDSIPQNHVEEMIREWTALVTERDMLVHEEVVKEENGAEKTEYLQNLWTVLRDMPSLDQSYDECSLRDALLSLERRVSTYCHTHNIQSPSHTSAPFMSLPTYVANGVTDGSKGASSHPRSSTPVQLFTEQTDSPEVVSLPARTKPTSNLLSCVRSSKTQFRSSPPKAQSTPVRRTPSSRPRRTPPPPPVTPNIEAMGTGQFVGHTPPLSSITPVMASHGSAGTKETLFDMLDAPTDSQLPPLPPPPPPPPPILMGLAYGTAGTGQFVGSAPSNPLMEKAQQGQDPDAHGAEASIPGNLLDDIESIGRKQLRRSSRARSPGGTPIKPIQSHTTMNGNILQRALMNKFRNLRFVSKRSSVSSDHSSFDASNAWSEFNGSIENIDPDITTGNLRNATNTSAASTAL